MRQQAIERLRRIVVDRDLTDDALSAFVDSLASGDTGSAATDVPPAVAARLEDLELQLVTMRQCVEELAAANAKVPSSIELNVPAE